MGRGMCWAEGPSGQDLHPCIPTSLHVSQQPCIPTSLHAHKSVCWGPMMASAMDVGPNFPMEQWQEAGATLVPVPVPKAGSSCVSRGRRRLPGGAEQQRQCTASSQFAPV